MSDARQEFSEGWGVLLASAAGFGLGLSGLPFYTMGVFVAPLGAAFDWSLAEIQGGLTVMLLANVATLPAAAWLAGRFGARPVALMSVTLFALSFMALSTLSNSLTGYYLHWLAVSAAGAGTLPAIWAQVISVWFSKARGLALGLAMMGTGITALFAPLLANSLIANFGWRDAYVVLGLLPLVVSLPLVWALFRKKDVPRRMTEIKAPALAGRMIASNWRFWLIGVAFLLVGGAVAGLIPNLVKLLRFDGFSAPQAAGIASVVGLFVIFGRAACGALLDRFWAAAVAAVFFGLAAMACLLLRADRLDTVAIGAAAAALGLAAGAEFDILPYLTGRYFGVERVGMALGLLSMFFYVGSAVGPWEIGRLADVTGNYDLPLLIAAGCFVLGGGALLVLGRYPPDEQHKD